MIFVDTGAWFASVVPWDANHAAAAAWLAQDHETLITTDYILDETLTLLRVRTESARALAFGEQLLSQQLGELYFLQEADLHDAWQVFAISQTRNGASPTALPKSSSRSSV
jgi:hypothetical protein